MKVYYTIFLKTRQQNEEEELQQFDFENENPLVARREAINRYRQLQDEYSEKENINFTVDLSVHWEREDTHGRNLLMHDYTVNYSGLQSEIGYLGELGIEVHNIPNLSPLSYKVIIFTGGIDANGNPFEGEQEENYFENDDPILLRRAAVETAKQLIEECNASGKYSSPMESQVKDFKDILNYSVEIYFMRGEDDYIIFGADEDESDEVIYNLNAEYKAYCDNGIYPDTVDIEIEGDYYEVIDDDVFLIP